MSELKSFSLTHVQYDPEDVFGKLLAAASLLPLAMLVSYITLIGFRRDLATIFIFIGQLLNEGLNYVLKKSIKEPRPTSNEEDLHEMEFTSDFIRSSLPVDRLPRKRIWNAKLSYTIHVVFCGVFISLYNLQVNTILGLQSLFYAAGISVTAIRRLSFKYTLWKPILIFGIFISTVIVSYSRIHLRYHTVRQVQVGAVLGTLFGFVYYVLSQRVVYPFLVRSGFLNSWIASFLLLRDTRPIQNILVFEKSFVQSETMSKIKSKKNH